MFSLLALNAWSQVVLTLANRSSDPAWLVAAQAVIGAAAAATALGSWLGWRWAPLAAVAYGLLTAGMLLALGPMLELPPDSIGGLQLGALVVLGIGLASGWFLRRKLHRA